MSELKVQDLSHGSVTAPSHGHGCRLRARFRFPLRGSRTVAFVCSLLLLAGWAGWHAAEETGGAGVKPEGNKPRVVRPEKTPATEEESGKEKEVQWTRVESTPIRQPVPPEKRAGSVRIEVGEIASVVGAVQIRRSTVEGEEVLSKLEAGQKVYVGDQFEVGKASAVEMTFGVNARVRVGSESIMRVLNKVEESNGRVISTQRDMALDKGSARVQVNKNLRAPSPVLLIAGSMVLTLERSDAMLKRSKLGSTVMVLQGGADVVLKDPERPVWSAGRMIRLKNKEKIFVPEKVEKELPSKETMEDAEVKQAKKSLTFSIERERENLPPAPTRDDEIDAP